MIEGEVSDLAAAPPSSPQRPRPCPLDEIAQFISRFIYAKPCELDALAVWIAHTYVYNAFAYTPRLGVFAEQENAGKSTVLKMILAMGNNPVKTMNASSNAIYAIIAQRHPTLLIDESDNIFGRTGSGDKGRVLRGILNEGVEEDGVVLRVVGGVPTPFPVFGPAAFAGIGQLPKTMMSRCVLMNLKPAPEGSIEPYDKQIFAGEANKIKEALKAWVTSRGAELNLYPPMPAGFYNRAGQIWRVMISIGDAAGPAWGKRIRDAALEIALKITATTNITPAEDLIQTVADNTLQSDFLPSADLIKMLSRAKEDDNRILWADWLSDPILAARQISAMLRPYAIESKQKWLDGENRRGYFAADFHLWAQEKPPVEDEADLEVLDTEAE